MLNNETDIHISSTSLIDDAWLIEVKYYTGGIVGMAAISRYGMFQ